MVLKKEILITTTSLVRDCFNELVEMSRKVYFLPGMACGFLLCTKLRNFPV